MTQTLYHGCARCSLSSANPLSVLTFVNLAPLPKMAQQAISRQILIRTLVHFADIQRPVRPVEASNSSHVITIFRVLLPTKAISRVVYVLSRDWQAMEEITLSTIWTPSTSKEETDHAVARGIGTSVSCISGNHTSCLRKCLPSVSKASMSTHNDKGSSLSPPAHLLYQKSDGQPNCGNTHCTPFQPGLSRSSLLLLALLACVPVAACVLLLPQS